LGASLVGLINNEGGSIMYWN